jgi:hypothetical protein
MHDISRKPENLCVLEWVLNIGKAKILNLSKNKNWVWVWDYSLGVFGNANPKKIWKMHVD